MSIDDGTYEAIVVDATDEGDDVVAIEIAISSGARRGELVRVLARNLGKSEFDLLAAPVTLIVTDGTPRLVFD